MIHRKRRAPLAFLLAAQMLILFGAGFSALAQQRPYRVSDRQVETLLNRIETRSDAFRQSLAAALNRSRLDDTNREDNINQYVGDFEAATDRLRMRFNNRQTVAADVQEVLNRAAYIDGFMRKRTLAYRAERDWETLRADLDTLAGYYNVSWRWNSPGSFPPAGRATNRLTGTYRLDVSRSDNVESVVERATSGLSYNEQQRIRNMATRRLAAPDMLALERVGRRVTVASSLAPQATFDADGRARVEQTRRGREVRVNATLVGDQLIVSSIGDRGNDYRVTFEPIDYGRRLRVTRRIDVNRINQPVTVVSVYDRTADVAQWDLFDRYDRRDTTDTVGSGYAIANETELVAVLNDTLNTEQTRAGDRFTLTVQSPSRYAGAVIEGRVVSVDRAERFSGRADMGLDFDRIRMRDGSSYNFEGYLVSVRTRDGDTVRVDNEGVVKEDDSQGERTLKRSGIGAALGAIIGAIAGGGEGAAIGAAVGAGAGAGSVFVTGRDDLELMSGTEMTLRALTPRGVAARR